MTMQFQVFMDPKVVANLEAAELFSDIDYQSHWYKTLDEIASNFEVVGDVQGYMINQWQGGEILVTCTLAEALDCWMDDEQDLSRFDV